MVGMGVGGWTSEKGEKGSATGSSAGAGETQISGTDGMASMFANKLGLDLEVSDGVGWVRLGG